MNCRRARRLLSSSLDDDLSVRDHIGLERHLSQCVACSAAAHDLHRIVSGLGAMPRSQASAAFDQELDRRLTRAASAPLRTALLVPVNRWRPWRLAGASVGLLAVAAALMYQRVQVHADSRAELDQALNAAGAHSMALAAANPLDDVTVANLNVHLGTSAWDNDRL